MGNTAQPFSTPGDLSDGEGTFMTDGLRVSLSLTREGLEWSSMTNDKTGVLPWLDVITCQTGHVTEDRQMTAPSPDGRKDTYVRVHYIHRREKLLRNRCRTFVGSYEDSLEVAHAITNRCKEGHPSRLLVIINPVGGTGKGEKQYARKVAPLFKLAEIDVEVIVSQHPTHPVEIGVTYDFNSVDGVVLVGGDGTYVQVVNSMLSRRHMDHDVTDPDSELECLTCPVGLIPTGSANLLARLCYGSVDVETAALNIVSGCKVTGNVSSVCHDGKLLTFSGLMVGKSFWLDVIYKWMGVRRLGVLRYLCGIVETLLKKKSEFYAEVQFIPYDGAIMGSKPEATDIGSSWQTTRDHYTGWYCFPFSVRQNEAAGKFLFDNESEALTLVTVKSCTKLQYLDSMKKVMDFNYSAFQKDFITIREVKAFRLKILEVENQRTHIYNVDGEIRRFQNSDMELTFHGHMLEMFGTSVMQRRAV